MLDNFSIVSVEYQSFLTDILNATGCGLWYWDPQDDRLFWDSTMYSIYKKDPANWTPKYGQFIGLVHPDDVQFVNYRVQHSVDNASEFKSVFRVLLPETRYIRAYGRTFNSNGKNVIVGINIEISEDEYISSVDSGLMVPGIRSKYARYKHKVARKSLYKFRSVFESAAPILFAAEHTWCDTNVAGIKNSTYRKINHTDEDNLIVEVSTTNTTQELHYHEYDEIITNINGGVITVWIEGERYDITKGQSLLIPKTFYHKVKLSGNCKYYVTWLDVFLSEPLPIFIP